MKRDTVILALVLALLLATAGGGWAYDDGVERPREVLGGGASDAAGGGGVTLRATLGQPLVGVLSGGEAALGQGFWHGAALGGRIYLPLVMRE